MMSVTDNIALPSGERGVIASYYYCGIKDGALTLNMGDIPEVLRYLILYWDKVIITDSGFVKVSDASSDGKIHDVQILQDAGLLVRKRAKTTFATPSTNPAWFNNVLEEELRGQLDIALEVINSEPGAWTIHQRGATATVPSTMQIELLTAELELNRCLPVPKRNIPIGDIIEFKHKRYDELIALREIMDEIYLEITRSADIPRAKNASIARLERVLLDLKKAAKISWNDRIFASRKVSVDLGYESLERGVSAGMKAGALFASPLIGIASGIMGAVASSVRFETKLSTQLNPVVGTRPDISYLLSMNKKGFIK